MRSNREMDQCPLVFEHGRACDRRLPSAPFSAFAIDDILEGMDMKLRNKIQKQNAFTLLEMLVVMLIIAIVLILTLPNLQQKEKIIRNKGCSALIEVVNSAILLYEIDQEETPTSIDDLIAQGYLKEGQNACPNGKTIYIQDGQANHE